MKNKNAVNSNSSSKKIFLSLLKSSNNNNNKIQFCPRDSDDGQFLQDEDLGRSRGSFSMPVGSCRVLCS